MEKGVFFYLFEFVAEGIFVDVEDVLENAVCLFKVSLEH